MKIRNDFVSNSSSSSFIIDNVDEITDDIPFKDLKKAVLSCFPNKLLDSECRIYDLTTKESFQQALEKEKDFLKGWMDTMNENLDTYEDFLRILKDYGKIDFDLDKLPWQQEDKPLQKPVIQTINIIRRNMGIKNLLEVLEDRYGKILICMEENLVWSATGMTDKKGYQSEDYTANRFCELVAKKLWELGYDNIDYKNLKFCFHGNSHQG